MNSNQDLKVELKALKIQQKELSKAIKATEDYIKRSEIIDKIKSITKTLTEAPEVVPEVDNNVSVVLPTPAFTNNIKPKKEKAPKKDKN